MSHVGYSPVTHTGGYQQQPNHGYGYQPAQHGYQPPQPYHPAGLSELPAGGPNTYQEGYGGSSSGGTGGQWSANTGYRGY